MTTHISGSLVRGAPIARAERVRTYPGDRVCAHTDCVTILSIYNPTRYCGLHTPQDRSESRRKVTRPLRQGTCEHCGAPFETANPMRKFCSDHCRMAAFAYKQRRAGSRARPQTREHCDHCEVSTDAA
jgi:hypothetical protein